MVDKIEGIEGGGLDDLPLDKVVQHAKGNTGWVLAEDNTRTRPTFFVMTGAGQRVWWFQDRCKVLNEGDPFVEAVRKGMSTPDTKPDTKSE